MADAVSGRRRRGAIVRVEVQTPEDVALIHAVAAALRGTATQAETVRRRLRAVLLPVTGCDLIDTLRCDVPDAIFDEMLERPHDLGRDDIF